MASPSRNAPLGRSFSSPLPVLTTFGDRAARKQVTAGGQHSWLAPPRSGGNDHGSFHPQFRVQVFEKPSGWPDLNRRPLDPQAHTSPPPGHFRVATYALPLHARTRKPPTTSTTMVTSH